MHRAPRAAQPDRFKCGRHEHSESHASPSGIPQGRNPRFRALHSNRRRRPLNRVGAPPVSKHRGCAPDDRQAGRCSTDNRFERVTQSLPAHVETVRESASSEAMQVRRSDDGVRPGDVDGSLHRARTQWFRGSTGRVADRRHACGNRACSGKRHADRAKWTGIATSNQHICAAIGATCQTLYRGRSAEPGLPHHAAPHRTARGSSRPVTRSTDGACHPNGRGQTSTWHPVSALPLSPAKPGPAYMACRWGPRPLTSRPASSHWTAPAKNPNNPIRPPPSHPVR